MKIKTAKFVLLVFVLFFIGIGLYFCLRNFSYFDIMKINVSYSGPVSKLPSEVNTQISMYKGLNLFSANLNHLEHKLRTIDGVDNAVVKRFFPNGLLVDVSFKEYQTRLLIEIDDNRIYFIADADYLTEVSGETFEAFSELASVEIREDYAKMLLKWGPDNGFIQMCNLAQSLGGNNLITNIKYVNNNNNDFGLMVMEVPSSSARLSVREPVTPERMLEALEIVLGNPGGALETTKFDLYANALVKRK